MADGRGTPTGAPRDARFRRGARPGGCGTWETA